MSIETTPQPVSQQPTKPTFWQRIVQAIRAIEWTQVLLVALITAIAWCSLFLANNILQILAGVVPVMAGIYLGRKVRGEYLANGLALGLVTFAFGLAIMTGYGLAGESGIAPMPVIQLDPEQPAAPATLIDLITIYFIFSAFALIPFPAFGTVMSGRAEERNRQLQKEIAERGGRLERPGVVRTLEDLQGLSLPQFGSYVLNLFRKKGFEFQDYRFIDKDKHLDLTLTYEGVTYLLRLSVADKVRPGTLESLLQDMKRSGIPKGLVITSTEFTPDTVKAASGRRNVLIIDGKTLFAMAEG
ncbi:restriction endonuclease [Chloroflexus sp.]|uniref:restriction endonuclease n=1 Tax=Chloroflexus sp. TaxID=1904827 RepID=UPI00262BFC06|nr:restriction endonuclease [uncultured Chloroflexus sp.]